MTVPTPPTDYHYHQGEALQHLRTANPTNDAEHLAAANTHAALALAATVHAFHEDWNRPVDVTPTFAEKPLPEWERELLRAQEEHLERSVCPSCGTDTPPSGPHCIVATGWDAKLPAPGLFVVCACSHDDTGYGDGTQIPIGSYVSEHLGIRDDGPTRSSCPSCGSPRPFEVRPPCSLDRYDPHPWHRDRLRRSSGAATAAAHDLTHRDGRDG